MRGLTQIRGASGFAAVGHLRALASEVRQILGPDTKIGYAADWSEYFGYQPTDGSGDRYFHLDPLWADENIDFIGIDNYMPLSDWRDGDAVSTGPVVSSDIAGHVVKMAGALENKGAKVIKPAAIADKGPAFVEPGIYDVTGCDVPDEEIFGPVLQVIRVKDWNAAITEANNTKFGLAAGLISDDTALWDDFRARIRAGVVNFNRPTTGAASFLPFGGPGASGNHNPGAYYAADFCAWPMASQVADSPEFMPMKGQKT